MNGAVPKWPTVCGRRTRDGSRYAEEFRFYGFCSCSHDRITVSAHVDEIQMRRIVRIAYALRCREVARLRVLQRALYAVLQREIDGRFVFAAGALGDEQRT